MKIVINASFGGFGLSPAAVKRLAELKGRECYFFRTEIAKKQRDLGRFLDYIPATPEEASESFLWSAFDIPNPEELLAHKKDWAEMTEEERKASNELYSKHNITSRPDDRTDPDLIKVVEELGDAANGRCARLKVIEIPDGIEYTIDDYDGQETVSEKHRSWG